MQYSLELDDEDKIDHGMAFPMLGKPDYPPGLTICFDDSVFRKLRIDPTQAEEGGIFQFTATAKVTCVTTTDSGSGKCHRVEAQIIAMGIDEDEMEDEAAEAAE